MIISLNELNRNVSPNEIQNESNIGVWLYC